MATSTTKKSEKKPAKKVAAKKESKAAATPVESTAAPNAPVNTTKFEIRDDIPCPPRMRAGNSMTVYPFANLVNVGQYFIVPNTVDRDLYTSDKEYHNALQEEKRAIHNRVSGSARRFMKSNLDVKLAVRVLKDGSVGVWRVDAE